MGVDKLRKSKKKWNSKLKDIKKGFNKMRNNVKAIFRKVKRNVKDKKLSVVKGINSLSDLVKRVAKIGFFKDILNPLRARWLAIEKHSRVLDTARLGKERALQALKRIYQRKIVNRDRKKSKEDRKKKNRD